MKIKIIGRGLAAALVLGCGVAHSGVVEVDSAFGNATAFVDESTGIQWLDLSMTFNIPIDEVTANLNEGGRYSGFRYATVSEVSDLLAGLGLQFSTNEIKDTDQYKKLDGLLQMMEVPSGPRCCDAATIRAVYGVTSTIAPTPTATDTAEFYWASWMQSTENGYSGSPVNVTYDAAWVEPKATRFRSDQTAMPFVGHWLIHEAPEPSSILLLLLGLACIAVARKAQLARIGSVKILHLDLHSSCLFLRYTGRWQYDWGGYCLHRRLVFAL